MKTGYRCRSNTFDRFQGGQSNDNRAETSHAYTYEVMSDREENERRKMKKGEG